MPRAILAISLVLMLLAATPAGATPPPGIVVDAIGGSWNEVVGVTNLPDGRLVAWERGGRVWMMNQNGARLSQPLLDIHEEVGAWRDFGLLGLAIDPGFPTRPYIYLLYVVDRHHLMNWGTPNYSSTTDEYYAASIGRIARYELDASTNYTTARVATRRVLLGESASTGLPVCHQSHSVGTLAFGADGTLLVSMGDSASYLEVDLGGQLGDGYISQALADGIISAKENVGAFRSQLVDSHCGKILRIDPETGNGIPSNPYFDAAAPRAARSRVWALGLRNPFRICIRPETGSHDPSVGAPGVITTGDVGWNTWEEFSVIDGPGQNLGWPIFEGIDFHPNYAFANTTNLDAPNPDAGGACAQTHLYFRDLLRQDTNSTAPQFLRPCGVHEAEDAIANNAPVVSSEAGYTGSAYRDFGNQTSAYIEWTVVVPATGQYQLSFRYANLGPADRPQIILVDGAVAQSTLSFPATDSWRNWKVATTASVQLTAGSRKIRMKPVVSNGPNVDCLWLSQGGSVPSLPTTIPTWKHTRPSLEWQHGTVARTPAMSGNGASIAIAVGATGGATGAPFGGYCALGGPEIHFASWPESWHGVQLCGDFAASWIRALRFAAAGSCGDAAANCTTVVTAVEPFDDGLANLVGVFADPVNEAVYAARMGILTRYRYLPGGSQPPTARATATPGWGPSPLPVQLSAEGSTDPEGASLSYRWQFGDGSPDSTSPTVSHTFVAPTSAPAGFTVSLTVTDPGGASDSTSLVIGPNNSPPTVNITTASDGQLYSMQGPTILPLAASVIDAEHPASQIQCEWQTILHHDTHEHPEPIDPSCLTDTLISPLGCDTEEFFVEIAFKATDAAGLSASTSISLFPDCNGTLQCPADLNADSIVDGSDLGLMLSNWMGSGVGDVDQSGQVDASDLGALLAGFGSCP